ncbi:MAG: PAS domain-containing protein [Ginsengibacter sp.]
MTSANLITEHKFLTGGGEMGELIRSFDWSKTSVGSPDTWPQTLRIAVRIMLDCPFGMYIAWGKEYIQLYNDGYRPILGATKHPHALGISTRQTFEEAWPTIGSMFEGVMQGTPVGFPDFILQLDRNGFVEECVFDFSYSPIRLEDGEVGGVLVTVIETTEKVRAVKALKESERRFQNLVREANIGIVVLTGDEMRVEVVNEAYGRLINLKPNDLLGKPLFDLVPQAEELFYPLLNKVRLTGESLYLYDQPYSVVTHGEKKEGYVNIVYQAYKETDGTISGVIALCQDVTETITSRITIEENEKHLSNERTLLYNSFMNAPAGIAILKGDTYIYEFANAEYEKLVKKKITLGKTVKELFPEVEQQGMIAILKNVFSTGEPFSASELPVELNTKGDSSLEKIFLNLVVQPVRDETGNTERLLAHVIDVTQQVNARKQIEASEKRFSNILSQSIMAIAILKGPELVLEFANEPMIATWRKGHDIIGKPVLEIMPEMKEQPFTEMLDQVYKTGVPYYGYEVKTINIQNGKELELYYNFVYQPFTEADNTITGVTILATEVTEQVNAKKLIEESELFNRTVLESSPDCLKVLDIEGRIQYMNFNGLCQMEIDDFSTFKNKNWWSLWGSENEALVKASVEKALTGETAQFTAFCLTAKGTPKWWDVVVSPVGNAGEPVKQIISVSRDITEQKNAEQKIAESEAQFRILADSIPQLAWIANGEGWIYWYNQRWYDYTGTTLDEMQGWGWDKVHHPDHIKEVVEFVKEAWKKDEAFELIFPLRRHDGVYRWFLTRAYPVKDSKGNIERWIGTNTDIDDQRKVLEQKDEFISIASHEMKTPLTAAKAYLQLLEMSLGESNGKLKVYARKANDSIEKLNQLIVDLLDVSKIQEGKINYNFTPFNLNELIESTVEDMQHSFPGHTMIKSGKTDNPVTGDKDRLQQVVINLLSNAIKYSPDSKEIYINIEETTGEVTLSIKDKGIGINKQHLQKIFDRYYRVEDEGTKFQGLGIGLYISNEIIMRHKGKMWVESDHGKGSTFYFTIPI